MVDIAIPCHAKPPDFIQDINIFFIGPTWYTFRVLTLSRLSSFDACITGHINIDLEMVSVYGTNMGYKMNKNIMYLGQIIIQLVSMWNSIHSFVFFISATLIVILVNLTLVTKWSIN